MGGGEAEELDAPRDLHAGLGQLLDQHALVLILGKIRGPKAARATCWPATDKFTASSRRPRSTSAAASPIWR